MRSKSPSDNIPNLDNLYEVLRDYIKEHQGEREYIPTDCDDNDSPNYANDAIYAIIYDHEEETIREAKVIGVRVENDSIEMKYDDGYGGWDSLRASDISQYIPNIFALAENIEEYV